MTSSGKILRTKLFRDVKSQKSLFVATIFILFLGIMLFCSFYLAYLNLHDTYESFYESSNFEDISVRAAELSEEDIHKIKKIDGVLDVQPRMVADGKVVVNGREYPAKVISLPENERIDRLYIAEGKKGFAVIKKFADYHGLQPNVPLTVRLGEREYKEKISALVYSAEFILIYEEGEESFTPSPGSFAIVYIPEKDMLSLGQKYNELKIKVSDESRKDEILSRILQVLGNRVEEFHTDEKQVSRRLLQEDLEGFKSLAVLFPAFFLLISVFSTYALLSRIVRLQFGNIAVMKALGFTEGEILRHYMWYPALVGISASIAGVTAGYVASQILTSEYVKFLNLPYFVSKPHPEIFLAAVVTGILTPLISGLFVARNAAKINIVRALRGYSEETFGEGFTTLISKFFTRILKLKLIYSLAVRNLARNRKRTAISLFSIVACTSLILNSMVFIDSFDCVMNLQFGKVYSYDVKVNLQNYDDGKILERIKHMDGVLYAEPLVETVVSVEKGGVVSSTLLIASHFQNLYNVYNVKGEKLIASHGIIFSTTATKNLSLVNGEKVTLYTEFGKVVGEVESLEYIPLFPVAVTSLDYFDSITGNRGYNTIVVDAEDGKVLEVAEKIRSIDGVRKVSTTSEAHESVMEIMGFFYAFVTFSLLFGASLGFAAIFNTTTISVIERSREFATLRMLGYTPKEIALSLIFESIILGSVGLLIGLPIAYSTAYGFFTSFESELYYLPMVIYPRTYILTVVAVFLVVFLALIPSIRRVSRMDISKVTKEIVS
ncbi:ABC transporter permease [Archaeoglobus neptunius]|uniref:ABC transporter permease n=1 Tax=Archaeoglobus neptunius TaxID=2798580 RepID=UPI001927FBE6|nr:FtsX-like permease family protein [Archaeoglobus neptunius]